MKSINIVAYGSSDCSINQEQFKLSYLKLFNDNKNLKYLSYTSVPFTDELVDNFITASKDEGVSYVLATDQKEIIGIAVTKHFLIEGFEILGLCVDETYRKSGIASKIISFCEEHAKQAQYKSVKVQVFADNKRMLRLLLKLDYIPVNFEFNKRFDGMDVVELRKRV